MGEQVTSLIWVTACLLPPSQTYCAAWSTPFTRQREDSNQGNRTMTKQHVGVELMTYGSPATLDDIPVYIKNVYGGREPSPEVLTEFRRRYDLIGGSPLVRITNEQAA